jgi:hypothetical protein
VVVSYCAKLHSDQSGTWTIFVRVCAAKDSSAILSQARRTPTHTPHARAAEKGSRSAVTPVAVRTCLKGRPAARYFESLHPRLGAHASSGGPFSSGQQRIAARAARLPTTYALAQPEAADHDPRRGAVQGGTFASSSAQTSSTDSEDGLAHHECGPANSNSAVPCCRVRDRSADGGMPEDPVVGDRACGGRLPGRPLVA